MLFQPTSITPSSRGELGNGTVDASQPLTVSWQVNGNSAMVAFSIVIYQNNAASTQIYATGKLTSGCPFYGTDSKGEQQLFSYTIPSVSGMTNGGSYKLVITQWWSASEYVTQMSAAAFVTRAAPSLVLSALPDTIAERVYTFTATYSQAQGDALNWVRWMLAESGETETPLFDSGNIYGTAELAMTYDGFFRGTEYAVRCIIQTENGIEADTGWETFSVDYDVVSLEWAISASKACGRDAVSVSWPRAQSIPGIASGEYTLSDGTLELPDGSNITWDTVNGSAMSLATPWSLLYSASFTSETGTLLTVGLDTGDNIVISYDYTSRTITVSIGGNEAFTVTDVQTYYGASLVLVLTETRWNIRVSDRSGGLLPSTTLYPSEGLYPFAASARTRILSGELDSYQGAITSLQLVGEQETEYLNVQVGTVSGETIQQAMQDSSYEPEADENLLFLVDFTNGIDAGLLDTIGSGATGFSVYRRQGDSASLVHLADLPITTSTLLDYGAQSQQGPYVYEVFPSSDEVYLSVPIESNEVNPCFWNWSVLLCEPRENEDEYEVTAEYRFGNNLTSGTVANNNAPFVQANFTRYPTVQISPSNWKSGVLESLIGTVNYQNGNTYSDSISLRDAIYALSTSSGTMFLKNRKGDLIKIRPAGEIAMDTMDNTREQAQNVRFPWIEIGSADGVSITSVPGDDFYEEGEGL